jgi:hypothetical protein
MAGEGSSWDAFEAAAAATSRGSLNADLGGAVDRHLSPTLVLPRFSHASYFFGDGGEAASTFLIPGQAALVSPSVPPPPSISPAAGLRGVGAAGRGRRVGRLIAQLTKSPFAEPLVRGRSNAGSFSKAPRSTHIGISPGSPAGRSLSPRAADGARIASTSATRTQSSPRSGTLALKIPAPPSPALALLTQEVARVGGGGVVEHGRALSVSRRPAGPLAWT